MRISACLLAIFLLLPGVARAQSSIEALAFNDCRKGCDTMLDACCFESCAYSACIKGNSSVTALNDMAGLGEQSRDVAGEQAAVAICMPKVQPLQDCRAREAAAMAARKPDAPEPVPFIALECCRYWAEQRGGKTVVTGWFLNAQGKKITYTSEPVHPMSQAGTAYGMFALTNGVGYHVYFVDEGNANIVNGLAYVVRFADKVEPLYMLRVGGRFYLRLAPDMSSGYVVYNTPDEPEAFYELPLK